MKPFLELFEPRTPEEGSLKPLIESRGRDGVTIVRLRLFNVIADLSFVKPWLRNVEKRTNWNGNGVQAPILRYDKFLKGYYNQSFMVTIQGKPEVQLDISLTRGENAGITYLYIWQHRNPEIFLHALEILAAYFYTYS